MSILEAVESSEGPGTGGRFVWVFVSAFDNFWPDFGFVFALSQLFNQMFYVEAICFIEQSHFLEDAIDVALCFLVVGEIPFFVFGN